MGGAAADKLLFRFSKCVSFRRYSRSKSKVVRNRAKFGTIFGPPKFWGAGLSKIVPSLSLLPRGTSTAKFHEDTPTSPEVIEPNTLNFRPNFKFSRLNFIGGNLDPLVGVR